MDDALDAKALEAALIAHLDGVGCTPWTNAAWDRDDGTGEPRRVAIRESVERAITAYLAARSEGRKAADTALSERVAELERGLEPFAACADIAEDHAESRDGEEPQISVCISVSASFRGTWGLVCVLDSRTMIDDFRRARALLHPSEGEAET
jgi:hypothetical protein